MRKLLSVFILILVSTAFIYPQAAASGKNNSHTLDFWVGDWNLTWGKDKTGTNHVVRLLDNKVVEENFDAGTWQGKSFSVYDSVRQVWQQTWIDSQGGYLLFEGGVEGNTVVLNMTNRKSENKPLRRMIFHNIEKNSFDWSWEKSDDGGKSWQVTWKIHYERKR